MSLVATRECRRPRATVRDRNHGHAGQAIVPVLAVGFLVLCAACAVGVLGVAHAAAARAQRAADLAAISAGRALVAHLAAPRAGGSRMLEVVLRAAALPSVEAADGHLVALRTDGAAGNPTAVVVEVLVQGPLDIPVRAAARAGLAFAAVAADGPVTRAAGGGYDGPLVYRDGKPTCPPVAAAFDLMDAAAHADGIDLVVNSGFRSDAEQAILFARHPDPRWVAPPGRSRHRDATELDISMGGGVGWWLARNAPRFGFVQRYAWEDWHYGYLPGCGTPGTSTAAARDRAGTPVMRPAGLAPATLPGWVPERYVDLIRSAAVANGVQPVVLAALLQAESGFNPRAVSPVGALGIAQLMPATAAGLGVTDATDPRQAVPAAARYLGEQLRAFGSLPLALAAYNAGPGAVRRYGGIPPYRETQGYVARILALAGGAAVLPTMGGGVVLLPMPA